MIDVQTSGPDAGPLADAIEALQKMGYVALAFDGEAEKTLDDCLSDLPQGPIALVLGAEGPGLRDRTKSVCDTLVRIEFAGAFGSLNVSNAAAVGLYAAQRSLR